MLLYLINFHCKDFLCSNFPTNNKNPSVVFPLNESKKNLMLYQTNEKCEHMLILPIQIKIKMEVIEIGISENFERYKKIY